MKLNLTLLLLAYTLISYSASATIRSSYVSIPVNHNDKS